MEIVITTTIRFIKKVTKSNIGENNLIENNKNNRNSRNNRNRKAEKPCIRY